MTSTWNQTAGSQHRTSIIGPLELVTAATAYCITLDEAKVHLRVDGSHEDAEITRLIKTATRFVEREATRQMLATTYDLPVAGFWCGPLKIPRPPLQSVTSVKYYDTSGTEQTLATSYYSVRKPEGMPGWIERLPDQSWPSVDNREFPVTIRYVAGYASAEAVPMTYQHAILLLIGHWYENREASLVGTISKEAEFAVSNLINSEAYGTYG